MKQTISIIGSGPSALLLAAMLDSDKYQTTIYERNFAPGRKFLVAGDGGFNLTHSEDLEQFIQRYTPPDFLEKSLRDFSNKDLCAWLGSIGIETYTGTSKRIFPAKGTKPIDVLNAILKVLKEKNVELKTQHSWRGWDEKNRLIFSHNKNEIIVESDHVVFALGGASWSKTGSDGYWTNIFEEKGIDIITFQPSNCAYGIQWDKKFIEEAHGKFLKNITITCNNKMKAGEVVITKFGIEGGAIYALSPEIRKLLNEGKRAVVYIDMKPAFTPDQILEKFGNRGNRSVTKLLEDELNFDKLQIDFLKGTVSKEEFTDLEALAKKIKQIPLVITSMGSIDEAISTVGGVPLKEVDEHFQLKKLPKQYCIGEMLDWDAPTGGYLLQACFSMGNELAKYLNSK